MLSRAGITLRTKLTLLAVASVAVTVLATFSLSALHYWNARDREYTVAVDRIEQAAAVYADRIEDAFRLIELDARVLAELPTVTDLAMADPGAARSQLSDLRSRLGAVFAGLITVRPAYTQIRLIRAADNWREIVRVNRSGDDVEVVAWDALQIKGAEPYLAASDRLGAGQSYFSRITPNRENGEVTGPPTLRFVRPVLDPEGALFGVVVINADYENTLLLAQPRLAPSDRVTVVNDTGDYMVFDNGEAPPVMRFRADPDWAPPLGLVVNSGQADEGPLTVLNDRLLYRLPIRPGAAHQPFDHQVITEYAFGSILSQARQTLPAEALLGTCLVLLAGAVATVMGGQIVHPLIRLNARIQAARDTGAPITFPPGEGDEIGHLADSFTALTNDLVRENTRFHAIMEGAADAILTLSPDGLIEGLNPAAEALFGWPAEQVTGRPVQTLMPLELSVERPAVHRGLALTARRRDGTEVPLEITVSASEYAGVRQVIVVARDVTERHRADRAVADLVAKLERSNAELDKFAYVASHDLKAPLRVIDNASRWLEEDLAEVLTEDTRESLGMLRGRVARMHRLLDDLLRHARIGRHEQPSREVTGEEMARDLAALLDPPDGFDLIFEDSFLGMTMLNTPLQTILVNLLSNAISHHDRPRGTVRVSARDLGDEQVFTVADDGPGIAPEYHRKVFEMFQTLKSRDEHESSGMGLAIVAKYLTLAGGRAEIGSDTGRGTEVRIYWPKSGAGTTQVAA